MKRIISILTILAVLICSTGFAGIHCEPPAVFGALRDTFTDTDDPTFTDTTAFSEDYDLFLLSDTDDDKNKETSDESEKDNISDDNDTVDTGSDTSGDAEDSGRSDDSGDPGNEESPEDTENSENPDDPDNTDDPTDKEEEEPEDEPAPPVFIDLPISDDYFSQTQYSFYNVGKYLQYRNETFTEQQSKPGIDLDVARGWMDYESDGLPKEPVVVAVIDTGIDHMHPDLKDSMWINPGEIPDNGIDDDGNGYIDDVYGWDFYNDDNSVCHYLTDETTGALRADPDDCDDHGTHVAGLIGASKDNGIGIAGLASVGNIKIMSLKIHGGTSRKGKLSDAIKAIKYAERMGASVCNISWGTYTYSASLASAIRNSKMLFVCAAGNDGTNNDDRPIYPACFGFDNIISVGFVNAYGRLPFNSNYGRDTVDIVVPATDIMSTTVGSYSAISGSSMAAPQISAIAALLYSYGKHTWAGAVRDAILGSIREVDELEKIVKYPGIPTLSASINNIDLLPQDFTAPDFSIGVSYDADGIRINFSPVDLGGSGINTIRYLTGSRTYDDFKNGTEGLKVENNTLYLAKPGIYTFFVEDKSGNYLLKTLPIMDDIVLPYITDASLTVARDISGLTVSARVSDLHSGIRTVKYMRGRHSASEFKSSSAGTVLTPDDEGNVSFTVEEQGPYTIYASDNRGNTTTFTIMAYIRPVMAAGPDNSIFQHTAGLETITAGLVPEVLSNSSL